MENPQFFEGLETHKIGVLTYNQKHRKTYDTLCLLKVRGYENVTVFAQAMTYVKKSYPLVSHRPELIMDIPNPKELCHHLGYEYREGNFEDAIKEDDAIYLLCGAGLLPESFVKSHRIINSHPGYSPYARGLDAYKWSIYYGLPLGVTTHYLGEHIDAGEVIERRQIFIKQYDTFHLVAQRIYENEVDMLVNAIQKADDEHEYIIPDNEVFKRMDKEKEKTLFDKFELQRELHCKGVYQCV